jgi:hypothetical protein
MAMLHAISRQHNHLFQNNRKISRTYIGGIQKIEGGRIPSKIEEMRILHGTDGIPWSYHKQR